MTYEELVARVAQAIRDSNGTPEALAWWKAHPQLVPADVYARAAIDAVQADLFGRPYTDAELARGQNDDRDRTLTLARLTDRVQTLEDRLNGMVTPRDTLFGYASGQSQPPTTGQVEGARAFLDGRMRIDLVPVKALDIAREIVDRAKA